MVIFLTGERGVGKSTALRRALHGCGLGVGGFMTDFGGSRYEENKILRLLPWAEEPDFSAGETCALLGPGGRQVFPEVFDDLGSRLLLSAAGDDACDLILLDELGFLEADAGRFRAAVRAGRAEAGAGGGAPGPRRLAGRPSGRIVGSDGGEPGSSSPAPAGTPGSAVSGGVPIIGILLLSSYYYCQYISC